MTTGEKVGRGRERIGGGGCSGAEKEFAETWKVPL